jgi:hypothetical protein
MEFATVPNWRNQVWLLKNSICQSWAKTASRQDALRRGRRRSVYTLDEVRPFVSLIRNARFKPICVAPLIVLGGVVALEALGYE